MTAQKISLGRPKVVVMKVHSTVLLRTDCSRAVTTVPNTLYVIEEIQGIVEESRAFSYAIFVKSEFDSCITIDCKESFVFVPSTV